MHSSSDVALSAMGEQVEALKAQVSRVEEGVTALTEWAVASSDAKAQVTTAAMPVAWRDEIEKTVKAATAAAMAESGLA